MQVTDDVIRNVVQESPGQTCAGKRPGPGQSLARDQRASPRPTGKGPRAGASFDDGVTVAVLSAA